MHRRTTQHQGTPRRRAARAIPPTSRRARLGWAALALAATLATSLLAGCAGNGSEAEAQERALRVGDAARVETPEREPDRNAKRVDERGGAASGAIVHASSEDRRLTQERQSLTDSRVDEPSQRRMFTGARDHDAYEDSDKGKRKKKWKGRKGGKDRD